MAARFEIDDAFIADRNQQAKRFFEHDYGCLGDKLARDNLDIGDLTAKAQAFQVALPSWGVGTGGTRFDRFAGAGEPRNIFEKLEDCGTILKLVRSTTAVSLHIPWDKPEDPAESRKFVASADSTSMR
jgi:L-rhamnose isomerase/sugar isomerase